MISNFFIVVGQVVTLLLMIAVGFTLARQGWLSDETISHASHLLLYVVTPCMIIEQLQIEATAETVHSLLLSAVAMVLYYVVFLALIQLLFRREPDSSRAVYRFGSVYGNNGFMGIPLLAGVFGEGALIYTIMPMLMFNLFQWTQGVVMMGGRASVKKAVLNPGILGIIVGLVLFAAGVRLPSMVDNAMGLLADMLTPLAMIIIGAQIAAADLLSVFRTPKVYLSCVIKLLFIPAVMCVLLLPLHMEPLAYCSCVVLSACPAAGITGVFAQMFRRDTSTAARVVTLSTLLCVVTLPVFAVISEQISGLTL